MPPRHPSRTEFAGRRGCGAPCNVGLAEGVAMGLLHFTVVTTIVTNPPPPARLCSAGFRHGFGGDCRVFSDPQASGSGSRLSGGIAHLGTYAGTPLSRSLLAPQGGFHRDRSAWIQPKQRFCLLVRVPRRGRLPLVRYRCGTGVRALWWRARNPSGVLAMV